MLGLGMLSVSDGGSLTGFRKVGRTSSYDVGLVALHLMEKINPKYSEHTYSKNILCVQGIASSFIRCKIQVLTSVSEQVQYCCNV